jgi:hypothetical protein
MLIFKNITSKISIHNHEKYKGHVKTISWLYNHEDTEKLCLQIYPLECSKKNRSIAITLQLKEKS